MSENVCFNSGVSKPGFLGPTIISHINEENLQMSFKFILFLSIPFHKYAF